MTNKPTEKRIHEFELTVRTIDEIVPEMTTPSLQKWKSILTTTLLKIDRELTNTCLHTCRICFREEWGYRDELPSFWHKRGDAEICFEHEYKDSDKLLKDAGYEVDAFFPPEIQPVTMEGLKVMADHLPPAKTEEEHTYEELMDLL